MCTERLSAVALSFDQELGDGLGGFVRNGPRFPPSSKENGKHRNMENSSPSVWIAETTPHWDLAAVK
jgi:hypothetical protein